MVTFRSRRMQPWSSMSVMVFLLLALEPSLSQPLDASSKPITVLWSKPITRDWQPPQRSQGLELLEIPTMASTPNVLLAAQDGEPILLVEPGKAGPGQSIPLAIKARSLHIAEDGHGTFWIGGVWHRHMVGIAPHYESEAYLAKVDGRGSLIWERRYGQKTERTIQSLTALRSGGVVVTGINDDTTWLARISEDGEILWERFFGAGNLNSVMAKDQKIIVAALAARGTDYRTYAEDVGLWTFDENGSLLDQRTVRRAINSMRGLRGFGEILVHPAEGGIYVFSSSWSRGGSPTEAVKLDEKGNVLWRAEMPWPSDERNHCTSGITVLPGGDPLIACSRHNTFLLARLSSGTGAVSQRQVALPKGQCRLPSSAIFILQKDERHLWIFGSLGRQYAGASCSWLGEAALDP